MTQFLAACRLPLAAILLVATFASLSNASIGLTVYAQGTGLGPDYSSDFSPNFDPSPYQSQSYSYVFENASDGLNATVTSFAFLDPNFTSVYTSTAFASGGISYGPQSLIDLGFSPFNYMGLHAFANASGNGPSGGFFPEGFARATAGWDEGYTPISGNYSAMPDHLDFVFTFSLAISVTPTPPGQLPGAFGQFNIGDQAFIGPTYTSPLTATATFSMPIFGSPGNYYMFPHAAISAIASAQDGAATADGGHSAYLTGIFMPDGSTPESHGLEILFPSGLQSPNLAPAVAEVPEPASIAIWTLCLAGIILRRSGKRLRWGGVR